MSRRRPGGSRRCCGSIRATTASGRRRSSRAAMHACLERERLTPAGRSFTVLRIAADAPAVVRGGSCAVTRTPGTRASRTRTSIPWRSCDAVPPLRPPPRGPQPGARAALQRARRRDAGARDRREHRDLQRGERRAAAVAARMRSRIGWCCSTKAIGTMPQPFGFSAPDLVAFRERARSYDGLAAFRNVEFELSGVDQPERIDAAKISASLMDVLGVAAGARPAVHRTRKTPAASRSRSSRDGCGAASSAPTRRSSASRCSLDRRAYTIVGVMPRRLHVPQSRSAHQQRSGGRLRADLVHRHRAAARFGMMYNNTVVGASEARRDRAAGGRGGRGDRRSSCSREIYPAELREMGSQPDGDRHRRCARRSSATSAACSYVLLAAVGVVLLIACADIACLMLTRAAGARARDGDSHGARRRTRARDAAGAGRDGRARGGWRRRRAGAGVVGPTRAARGGAGDRLPRAQEIALRRPRPRLHRVVASVDRGAGLRPAAGDRVVAARLGGRAEGRRPNGHGERAAAADLRGAGHGAVRLRGRAARGRRTADPQLRPADRDRSRLPKRPRDLRGDQPAAEQLSDGASVRAFYAAARAGRGSARRDARPARRPICR